MSDVRPPLAGLVRLGDVDLSLQDRQRTLPERHRVGVDGVAVHHDDPLTGLRVSHGLQQRLALQSPHLLAVEGGVSRYRALGEAVVGDHGDARLVRLRDRGAHRSGVDGREQDGVDLLGDHGVHLRLLDGDVVLGVGVLHPAFGAQFLDPPVEQRSVAGLPPGRGGVREQHTDLRLAPAARVRRSALAAGSEDCGRGSRGHSGDRPPYTGLHGARPPNGHEVWVPAPGVRPDPAPERLKDGYVVSVTLAEVNCEPGRKCPSAVVSGCGTELSVGMILKGISVHFVRM